MLTVACVLVRGHADYTPEYVIRLKSMCWRYLSVAYRFVCLTDEPSQLPTEIETIKIPSPVNLKGWWAKLQLFNKNRGFSDRVLALDLDVLVVNSLMPIVEYPAKFALVPDGAPNFKPKGRAVVKRFNSSVMVWDAGVNDSLYDDWSAGVALRLWGDQDWIGERMADAAAMPIEWFPRLSECGDSWSADAKVILCKKPKNAFAAHKWEWFNEAWQ